ncbi:hypothetical protein FRB94_007667 [Tulasnella sp. JGI-2019a]|nr:hypothetical protein FRB93_006903 [Tulasnella sp. JGI-2019a]KAG8997420.1 hypothetical protein FRB94_007667 [Tulasnella sp. JGI-2019a]
MPLADLNPNTPKKSAIKYASNADGPGTSLASGYPSPSNLNLKSLGAGQHTGRNDVVTKPSPPPVSASNFPGVRSGVTTEVDRMPPSKNQPTDAQAGASKHSSRSLRVDKPATSSNVPATRAHGGPPNHTHKSRKAEAQYTRGNAIKPSSSFPTPGAPAGPTPLENKTEDSRSSSNSRPSDARAKSLWVTPKEPAPSSSVITPLASRNHPGSSSHILKNRKGDKHDIRTHDIIRLNSSLPALPSDFTGMSSISIPLDMGATPQRPSKDHSSDVQGGTDKHDSIPAWLAHDKPAPYSNAITSVSQETMSTTTTHVTSHDGRRTAESFDGSNIALLPGYQEDLRSKTDLEQAKSKQQAGPLENKEGWGRVAGQTGSLDSSGMGEGVQTHGKEKNGDSKMEQVVDELPGKGQRMPNVNAGRRNARASDRTAREESLNDGCLVGEPSGKAIPPKDDEQNLKEVWITNGNSRPWFDNSTQSEFANPGLIDPQVHTLDAVARSEGASGDLPEQSSSRLDLHEISNSRTKK